jgi:hypothetical protein
MRRRITCVLMNNLLAKVLAGSRVNVRANISVASQDIQVTHVTGGAFEQSESAGGYYYSFIINH